MTGAWPGNRKIYGPSLVQPQLRETGLATSREASAPPLVLAHRLHAVRAWLSPEAAIHGHAEVAEIARRGRVAARLPTSSSSLETRPLTAGLRLFGDRVGHVSRHQGGVGATAFHQLLVRPPLNDPPLVENDDLVGIADG